MEINGKVLAIVAIISSIYLNSGSLARADAQLKREILNEIIRLVRENFHRREAASAFSDRVHEQKTGRLALVPGSASFDRQVQDLLASLGASHTGRYLKSDPAYYELLDIYKAGPVSERFDRLFPPDSQVSYRGLGLATRTIRSRHFVSQIYGTSPASRVDLRVGDELIAMNGRPWNGAPVFVDGEREAVLTLRRSAEAPSMDVRVDVARIRPSSLFHDAIMASIETIDVKARKLGYIRIWSADTKGLFDEIAAELADGRLADADGLVLDLRGRWGGGPLDAANLFVGAVPNVEMQLQDGKIIRRNVRWAKPVVAIIDGGTRSGLETLAYVLKKNGVTLVGENTAGASLAATAFLLPDDSLLTLAVGASIVDGQRLEGKGVAPSVPVPFDIRYAAGDDPQKRAAFDELIDEILNKD